MAKKELINNEVATEADVENNVLDIDLGAIEKKCIRVNGDNTKCLYLNLSDLNIIKRFNEVYPKLKDLENQLTSLKVDDTDEFMEHFSETLSDIDAKMREYVDYIFDYGVSAVCVGNGTMYDPFKGKPRYEHILESLSTLYENSFNEEFKHMQERINKHTSKYHK